MSEIKKGEGEYIKCDKCEKRFRRKKSIWNMFIVGYLFCPKCSKGFSEWMEARE